jgi:hypothetical protein
MHRNPQSYIYIGFIPTCFNGHAIVFRGCKVLQVPKASRSVNIFLYTPNMIYSKICDTNSRFGVYTKIFTLLDALGTCNTLYPLKMMACPLKHVGIKPI